MSDNWVVQNLERALDTWNEKLAELWQLLTESPETFRGGALWHVITDIHGALQAAGYALLVLFFAAGVVRSTASFEELKSPAKLARLFLRFALAKAAVGHGTEILTAMMHISTGLIMNVTGLTGLTAGVPAALPQVIADAIENTVFIEALPLWIVTLTGSLCMTVLSYIMILTVYGRFFRIYMYAAVSPVALSAFGSQETSHIGRQFLKSFAGVLLEGAVIAVACVIFTVFASSPPMVDEELSTVAMLWTYIGEIVFTMLILVGAVKAADRLVREMTGLG